MHDAYGKLVNGIESMYVNSLACVRVKEVKSVCFRFNSGVRQGFIMSPWLFNVYVDAAMKGDEYRVRFLEGGKKWRLPALLYADDLVLCDELEEDLRAMMEHFVEVCRRRPESQYR